MIKIERISKRLTALVGSALSCFIILSIWSCSFSDDLVTTALEPDVDDDGLSIPIILSDGGEPMLLKAGDDNGVINAYFYFYDKNGYYLTSGIITDENENNLTTHTLTILTGLTDKSVPKYVVAVLNQPSDFGNIPVNLADMLPKYTSSIYDTNGDIIMASSSYFPTETATYTGSKYQFYTEISESNFFENGTTPTDAQILSIPVERLAAKITVNLIATATLTYQSGKIGEDDYTIPNLYQVGTNQYVELIGWKLNAIARNSYIFKNLKDSWEGDSPWSGWSHASDFYCSWAESYIYGKGTYEDYPENNSVGNKTDDEENSATWLSEYVKYVSLDDAYDDVDLLKFGSSGYCPENTNTVYDSESATDGIIADVNSTALTSVLIKARAWEYDDVEETYVPLVNKTGNAKGLMYYSIPIQHLNDDDDASTLSEGEYGVVRNHSYTLDITGVTGLGSVIGDDTEIVIVPESTRPASLTGLSALWSNHKEETVNNGDEFIDKTIEDD